MSQTKLVGVCIGVVLVAFVSLAQQGTKEDIVAEGTGLGVNPAEALMNAKRDAVEKGIGMVLVSQTEPLVEAFYKQNEKIWQYTVVKGLEERITFQTLQSEIALKDIYQKVVWESD